MHTTSGAFFQKLSNVLVCCTKLCATYSKFGQKEAMIEKPLTWDRQPGKTHLSWD